ncbi:hypothetical protein [Aeromicrobium sp. IC_218]|uniref:hypothetical protein n=1 Tax=Aeromicrobium sp. IC_218 TaxID=2545468 RepID=UPI0013F447A3|nr:hypothetical protein [Aeromicrobium sp. IC_218]
MPPLETDRRGVHRSVGIGAELERPFGVRARTSAARLDVRPDDGGTVFLFFSNRLGCLGSVLVSLVLTALLVLVLMAL